MTASLPSLEISPDRACLDTVLHIRLRGLPPHGEVTLRARQADPQGRVWQSAATFVAAADGTVDLARDAPVRGSYRHADPMGLVWSMVPSGAAAGAAGQADALAPACLDVAADLGRVQVAAASCLRLRIPDGLRRIEVRDLGLAGVLYVPDGQPRPGVLLLGGAEGGLHEGDAALLAAHGYAALALAYYGIAGLPATLERIPLEYFGLAVDYLRACGEVRGQIAAIGASKGGEAALLAAATFSGIGAVVSIVGSGAVTQGISQDVLTGSFLDIIGTPVACWTYRDRELPYLPNVVTPELERLVAAAAPIPLRLTFEPALSDAELVSAATIPAEQINGPVLLISASDDQGYGPAFHDIAAQRLTSRAHQHPWEHQVHQGAGHLIAAPPYRPTTTDHTPGPGVTFRHGGSPGANARATARTWQQTLRFLHRALAGEHPA